MTDLARMHTMDADAYHRDEGGEQPSLSASIAHLLCTASPAHAWAAHPRLNPAFKREEQEKFDVGTAAHALLLEGVDSMTIVDAPDWRTNAAKDARDEARANRQIPMLTKHAAELLAMVTAVREQLADIDADPPLLADGKPEQCLVWQELGGAVTCRARLDWLRHDHRTIDDLKTTSRSANPETWTRTLFGIGSDVQMSFYLRGARAVLGVEPEFRFIVCETKPPYAVSVVSLAPDALTLANKKVSYAIDLWARCLRDDRWPAYAPRVHYAELPPWEEARWLERELREVAA